MPPSIKGKNPVSKAFPQLINKIYALYISAAVRRNDLAGSIRNRPFSVPVPVPGPPASLPRTAPFRLGNARCVPAPAYLSPPSPDILLSAVPYPCTRTVLCPYAKNGSLPVHKDGSLPVHKGCSPPTPKGRRFPERPSLLLFKNS